MSATTNECAAPLPSVGPSVQPANPLLRQIGEAMGLDRAPTEDLADLPPWTDEEADAFERAVDEVCEQTEP